MQSARYEQRYSDKLERLHVETDLLELMRDINYKFVEFKKKYNSVQETILILGKRELNLLYKAHEYPNLEFNTDNIGFDGQGFISKI